MMTPMANSMILSDLVGVMVM